MRSLEAERLRRRWRYLVGGLVLCVLFIGLPTQIAYATTFGSYTFNTCPMLTLASPTATECTPNGPGNHWTFMSVRSAFGGGTQNALKVRVRDTTYQTVGGSPNATLCFTRENSTSTGVLYSGATLGSVGDSGEFNSWTPGSSTAANIPLHWWMIDSPGVTCGAGNDPGVLPTDASEGTSTCSRTLTDTSAMTGEFTAGRTGMTNATVTAWDWDWGDSTTHGTTQPANHTYGALSTMPSGGWTATVTMTVTATSGHLFSDSTTTQTGTCQLRVDFLHPENMTPGSTGSSGTGNSSLDSCIPSGWNVLNPLAMIGGIGCVLQKLFVPSSTTTDGLGHLWDTVTTHLPFSIVTGFVDYIPNMWSDFKWWGESVSPLTCGVGCNTSPLCTQFKGGSMPNSTSLDLCPGGDHYPFLSLGDTYMVGVLRAVMLFIIVALFVYAMWRGANEILQ